MLGVLDISIAAVIIVIAIGLFILTRYLTRRHKVNVPEYTREIQEEAARLLQRCCTITIKAVLPKKYVDMCSALP